MRLLRLLIICAATLAVSPSRAAEPSRYFPQRLWTAQAACPGPMAFRPTLMTDHRAEWYGRALGAVDEPSLIPAGQKTDAWRFLWLRSFHMPVIVRIDEAPGGDLVMTAKRLTGAGGYDPGALDTRLERRLTVEEARAFRALVAQPDFAEDGPPNCLLGTDGAQWVVETRVGGTYRFHDEWTPQGGAVADLGRFLLKLTRWDVEPIY